VLTTNQGVPVADNQNSLKFGLRGPALLEDFILREKITHFDHERIPERIVHARGSGAHGFFECYEPLHAVHQGGALPGGRQGHAGVRALLHRAGRARLQGHGARRARLRRQVLHRRGQLGPGGQQHPGVLHPGRDEVPDLVHAVKPEPHHQMPQAASAHDTFWDFVSLMPESTHMLMWVMSDRAIPRSYATMQGFGVHSFRLVNAAGESVFVKFHWTRRPARIRWCGTRP
jgi:catalase